ncbi:MAG: very short patch repair endonuclease [Phycisphaeraceae bacterium]|nr:very short patch repair endonuclease [Phycisphaeraceae bacterium]
MPPLGVKHHDNGKPQHPDPLTKAERSERMSRIGCKRNRSTEARVSAKLAAIGLSGWVQNDRDVVGSPDFHFPRAKIVIFVDGCFWHGCPYCRRRMPRTRRAFWVKKISENRRRDLRIARQLRRQGYSVLRVWEHEVNSTAWIGRLLRAIQSRRAAS